MHCRIVHCSELYIKVDETVYVRLFIITTFGVKKMYVPIIGNRGACRGKIGLELEARLANAYSILLKPIDCNAGTTANGQIYWTTSNN